MSLMAIYLQFAAASYLFIMSIWLMDDRIRKAMKTPSWMLGFGLGTVAMAMIWFLYVPIVIRRKPMMIDLAHEMLDRKEGKE